MRYRIATCAALLCFVACTAPSTSDMPLTASERAAIADSVRAGVYRWAEITGNPQALCTDPSPAQDHFAYPGGVVLSVNDTTPMIETQAEWEARGIPAEFWCDLERFEARIDSVVVHVLTRDVALSATPLYFIRVMKSGERYQAKGMDFQAWVRTERGWKATSSTGQYFPEAEPR